MVVATCPTCSLPRADTTVVVTESLTMLSRESWAPRSIASSLSPSRRAKQPPRAHPATTLTKTMHRLPMGVQTTSSRVITRFMRNLAGITNMAKVITMGHPLACCLQISSRVRSMVTAGRPIRKFPSLQNSFHFIQLSSR